MAQDATHSSSNTELQFQLLDRGAKPPQHSTSGSAGLDLFLPDAVVIPARASRKINLQIAVKIPDGCYGQLASRSSVALRGLDVAAGVIDSDFRGSINVLLRNQTDNDAVLKSGERICQLLCIPIVIPVLKVTNVLPNSTRDVGGFGSTGR